MDNVRFFVELERLEYCNDHWVSSFYAAETTTIKTPEGWRINRFKAHPEDLVRVNLGGHQQWQHDAKAVAIVLAGARGFEVLSLRYEGRTAVVHLRSKTDGGSKTMRLTRLMEGTWILMNID